LENNPQLKLMFGTFLAKSKQFAIAHPDIEIDGVPPEETSTDPKLDPAKYKANGKTNGKAVMKQ